MHISRIRVNAAHGSYRCLFRDPYRTHKPHSVGRQNLECLNIKSGGKYSKKYRQRTYNLTMKSVRAIIVAVEKQ